MTSWMILAVLAAFAAGLLSGTLLRRRHHTADSAAAAGDPSAAPARAEPSVFAWPWAGRSNIAVAVIAAFAVLGFVGLYASIAELDAPAPSSSSDGGLPAVERLAALSREPFPQAAPPPAQRSLPSVDEMIQRLVTRLRQSPNDPEGWRMLGWSYFSTERFDESAAAYLKAIALRPEFAGFRSLRGEALVKAANGTVTSEAASAFDDALKLDAADPRARFYKGLAKEQSGDRASAFNDWNTILEDADPNEPFLAEIRQRASELGRQIGADASGRLGDQPAAASGEILRSLGDPKPPARPSAGREGPTAEDVRAAQTMPANERTAMIRGMVDGLAARLEQSPRDVEGWIKLMRSRVVLGEADEARHAFDRALRVFDGAPQERDLILAAARELGLVQ